MTSTGDRTGLNILVCMKFLADPAQLQVEASSGRPDLAHARFRINTFDENAIETALQLVGEHGGRVIGLSLVTEAPPKDVVLKALAMGVDGVYLINDRERIAEDRKSTRLN